MSHHWCVHMDWCTRCGRPLYEILEAGKLDECDGLIGVVHARYMTARAEMWERIGPVINAVFDGLYTRR